MDRVFNEEGPKTADLMISHVLKIQFWSALSVKESVESVESVESFSGPAQILGGWKE
jgi:hypothetical protein